MAQLKDDVARMQVDMRQVQIDIAEIKEDAAETRTAANRLIEWADETHRRVGKPVPDFPIRRQAGV